MNSMTFIREKNNFNNNLIYFALLLTMLHGDLFFLVTFAWSMIQMLNQLSTLLLIFCWSTNQLIV